MKRSVELTAKGKYGTVRISARYDSERSGLTREEVENVRDFLADGLLLSISKVPYMHIPLNRVKVR